MILFFQTKEKTVIATEVNHNLSQEEIDFIESMIKPME